MMVFDSVAVDELLLVLKIAFLVLLYLFIWRIVRTASRDLRLPQESFILAPSAAAGVHVSRPGPVTGRLVVVKSADLQDGDGFELNSAQLTIGRGNQNDIPIATDEYASARHARFEPRQDGVWVQDLGSTNGTFLNGTRLDRPRRLAQGDIVRVGETDLRYEVARLRLAPVRETFRHVLLLWDRLSPRRWDRRVGRGEQEGKPPGFPLRPFHRSSSGERPMSSLGHVGAVTDPGRKRRRNEDAYVVEPPLFAVADGMGGAQAGEVASRLAAAALKESGADEGGEQRIVALIQEANRRVYDRSNRDPSASGMGTTMTVALVENGQVAFGHVGDSRAYLIRAGAMEQLTEDHSLVAELMRSGKLSPEEAESHPQRSVITRALGTDPDVDVDTFTIAAEIGDVFLLCSDGLTTMVSNGAILDLVERHRGDMDEGPSRTRAGGEQGRRRGQHHRGRLRDRGRAAYA